MIYAVTMEDFNIGLQYKEHLFENNEQNIFEKIEFNLSTGGVKRTKLIEDMQIEFPNLN